LSLFFRVFHDDLRHLKYRRATGAVPRLTHVSLCPSGEAKKRFPQLLLKVNQKQLRPIEYALETGTLPPAGGRPRIQRIGQLQTYRRTHRSGSIEHFAEVFRSQAALFWNKPYLR
jgi:hypothetical protein